MTMLEHAKYELEKAGYEKAGGGLNALMYENVIALLEVFTEQGHSGFSAPFCIELFTRLAKFQPLTPLTGSDDEWVLVSTEPDLYQNKRCPSVFKENGNAYDIDGKVFVEENGSTYVSKNSRVSITFPYVPNREYVKAEDE